VAVTCRPPPAAARRWSGDAQALDARRGLNEVTVEPLCPREGDGAGDVRARDRDRLDEVRGGGEGGVSLNAMGLIP
jgi:hypothetical protein